MITPKGQPNAGKTFGKAKYIGRKKVPVVGYQMPQPTVDTSANIPNQQQNDTAHVPPSDAVTVPSTVAPQGQADNILPPVPPPPAVPPVTAQTAQTLDANSNTDAADNRIDKRRKVLKGATIIIPNKNQSLAFSCRIRNETSKGVQINIRNATSIPNEFYLMHDGDPGVQIPCRVAWRKMDKLGVQYIDQLSSK